LGGGGISDGGRYRDCPRVKPPVEAVNGLCSECGRGCASGVEGIACKNLATLAVETSMKGVNTQAPNPRRALISLIREEPSRIEAAQACSYRPKYGGRPHYLREHAEYSTAIPLQFTILSHDGSSWTYIHTGRGGVRVLSPPLKPPSRGRTQPFSPQILPGYSRKVRRPRRSSHPPRRGLSV